MSPAPSAEPQTAPALELAGIVKRFGRTPALDGAMLVVRRGTVHALLGENGAGKTTLMRVAFGLVQPDAGEMRLHGAPFTPRSPADAIARGLGMVHQHFTVAPALTVAEHIALGGHGRYDPGRAADRVRALGRSSGLVLDPEARAETLGVAAQQRLEILKALAGAAGGGVLILDEPTAVLAPTEAGELLQWVRRYAAGGGTVVLITHKLREALAVADDLTVLRRGTTVLARLASESSESLLAAAMLGAPPPSASGSDPAPTVDRASSAGSPVLVAENVTITDDRGVPRLRGASVIVRGGEIVGIAGVEGSGWRELLRALAGRLPIASGVLDRPDELAFVPEDRIHEALAIELSLAENVALRDVGRARGRIRWGAVVRWTTRLLHANGVGPAEPQLPAGALSGGNQQRLVLARELDGDPAAVIAENPTRGLDLAATAAVHERLRAAARRGAAVVLHSSDVDELLALAGRVLVTHAGMVREVERSREAVGRAMLGLV